MYAAAEDHHSEQLYGLCDSYKEIMKANSWASEVRSIVFLEILDLSCLRHLS